MPVYAKFMSSIFFKKRTQDDEKSPLVSPGKSKPSFKDFRLFVRRNKASVEGDKAMLSSSQIATAAPAVVRTQTKSSSLMDLEVVEALQSVFDALHDPSLLDIRRHQRYDLYPSVEANEVMPGPRCDRIASLGGLTREISTDNHLALDLIATSPQPCLTIADRTTSRGSAIIDVVEIMHINAPHCDRTSSSLSRNTTLEVTTGGIDNAVARRPSAPIISASTSAVEAPMHASGMNVNPFSSSSDPLEPSFYTGPRIIDAMDMKILRFLGEGTTGKVYFVKDNVSKTKVALKVITKEDKNDYTLSTIVQEFEISKKLADSPWFVKLYASWHDQDHMYIAMTVYPIDLDTELMRLEKIEPERARFYMAEIIIALTELHSRGIIHRDVKAPNILIDREGHIVLADYGLSKDFFQVPSIAERVYQPYWPYLPHDNPTCKTEPRDPTELTFVAWDYRGSELEMAPEIHLREPYSFGVDFWSASVVLYWMLTGRPPWYELEDEDEDGHDGDEGETEEDYYEINQKPLIAQITEDELPWGPEDAHVDAEARDFLEKMLAKDPRKRLLISYEIPSHPYFAGINWPLLETRKAIAPWVPAYEICHAYEETSPTFTPGLPYSEEKEDPYPTFNYLSKQARRRIIDEDHDSSDEESVQGSPAPLTPKLYNEDQCPRAIFTDSQPVVLAILDKDGSVHPEGLPNEHDDSFTFHSNPSMQLNFLDDHDNQVNDYTALDSRNAPYAPSMVTNSLQEGSISKGVWDKTFISPAPTAPFSPGPKAWLYAQDFLRIRPKHSSTTMTSSATFSSALDIMYVNFESSQSSTLDASLDDHSSTSSHPVPRKPWSSLTGRQGNHVAHGTGLLSKVRTWWLSKTWMPRPKKIHGQNGHPF